MGKRHGYDKGVIYGGWSVPQVEEPLPPCKRPWISSTARENLLILKELSKGLEL
jgi:hypothetical protein